MRHIRILAAFAAILFMTSASAQVLSPNLDEIIKEATADAKQARTELIEKDIAKAKAAETKQKRLSELRLQCNEYRGILPKCSIKEGKRNINEPLLGVRGEQEDAAIECLKILYCQQGAVFSLDTKKWAEEKLCPSLSEGLSIAMIADNRMLPVSRLIVLELNHGKSLDVTLDRMREASFNNKGIE